MHKTSACASRPYTCPNSGSPPTGQGGGAWRERERARMRRADCLADLFSRALGRRRRLRRRLTQHFLQPRASGGERRRIPDQRAGGGSGRASRQRRIADGVDRTANDARGGVARRLCADRHETGVRSGRLLGLHGSYRRSADRVVLHPRPSTSATVRSRPSRGWRATASCIPCRRRSSPTTPCNAAFARQGWS